MERFILVDATMVAMTVETVVVVVAAETVAAALVVNKFSVPGTIFRHCITIYFNCFLIWMFSNFGTTYFS